MDPSGSGGSTSASLSAQPGTKGGWSREARRSCHAAGHGTRGGPIGRHSITKGHRSTAERHPRGIAERNLRITERHRSDAVLGIARCSRSRCRSGISIPAPPLPECSVSTWTRNFEGLPRAHRGLLTLLEIRQSENPGPRMNSPMASREGSIMVTFHCSGGRNSVYVDGRGVVPANGVRADPAHRMSIGKD